MQIWCLLWCLLLLNSNTVISVEEFMIATKGFTKMDRNTLFEFVDRNGKIYFSAIKHFHLLFSVSYCYILTMTDTPGTFQVTWSSELTSLSPYHKPLWVPEFLIIVFELKCSKQVALASVGENDIRGCL